MKEFHFAKAKPLLSNQSPLENISLVFDREYDEGSIAWPEFKRFQQKEAEEIYAALRGTMPQGVLDKLGALIMTDQCSDFIIKREK